MKGVITYENGDQYNGEVKDGQRNDHQGRYVYNNLDGRNSTISRGSSIAGIAEKVVKYVGGWERDNKQGEGTLILIQQR